MGNVEELRAKFERSLVERRQKFLEHKGCGGRFAKRNGINDIVYCRNYSNCPNQGRIAEGSGRAIYCTRETR